MTGEWLGRSKWCDRERRYQRSTPPRPECEDQKTIVYGGVEKPIHTLQPPASCLQDVKLVQLHHFVRGDIEDPFIRRCRRRLGKFELYFVAPIRQRYPVRKFALAEAVIQTLIIGEHVNTVGF